jgi:iron complex outermembrane receptor protein
MQMTNMFYCLPVIPFQNHPLISTRVIPPVSFSAGAVYHAGSQVNIKLNAATGFTAPNYAQLATFGKHEGSYRFERGDASLEVEQNFEGDGSVSWDGRSLSLTVSAFVNKVNNYIYIANTGDSIVRISSAYHDTLPLYDYRQGDATLTGGELGIGVHPKNAKWVSMNFTYSRNQW